MVYQRKYSKRAVAALSVVWCAIVVAVVNLPNIIERGHETVAKMKSTDVVVTCLGKIPQIVTNALSGSAGELSLSTTSLALLGNVVRIFTVGPT